MEAAFLETLRILAFLFIGFIIFLDLASKIDGWKFPLKIKNLTATNYLGIVILMAFVIWPFVGEANFGSLSFKKLDTKITKVANTVRDLYDRKRTEAWMKKDFEKISVSKGEKYHHYSFSLKEKPIANSVEIWLGPTLQNPMYYTVKDSKIEYRNMMDTTTLLYSLGESEPAFTVSYTKE